MRVFFGVFQDTGGSVALVNSYWGVPLQAIICRCMALVSTSFVAAGGGIGLIVHIGFYRSCSKWWQVQVEK